VAEAAAVRAFFDTRGESMLAPLTAEREAASGELDFERAARVHEQWQKVKAAQAMADELVRPIPKLRAVIVQKATEDGEQGAGDSAAIFLLHGGCLSGPARLSTLGVRAVREQTSVGSSLFAQPLMLEAVPLAEAAPAAEIAAPLTPAESPEVRAAAVIESLEERASAPTDLATLSDHLSLLRRWYYRPEKQRVGEVLFPKEDGSWPTRRILNGAARVVFGDPKLMAETQRELALRNPRVG
jgi:hypothetical protein